MQVFPRNIEGYLREWSIRPGRKPLVIRGARQTGKTTTVLKFAKDYPQYIHLNLDRYEDRKIFNKERALHGIVDELFFLRGLHKERKTLIFIDEIQRSDRAVNLLRYLHEDYPEYHIVAAGSLIEQTVDVKSAFPVGRETYVYMHPVSFEEFLLALGETRAVGRLRSLMQFLDMSEERCGVRLYAGSHSLDSVTTFNAKPFRLLNIPYYHAAKLPEYVRTLCPSADNSTVR